MVKEAANKTDSTEDLPVAGLAFGENDAHRQMLADLSILPRVTVFVARKINLGNFENVDFSMTAQVPLGMTEDQVDVFNTYANRAIEQGLGIVIPEVNAQTEKVKAQRRGTEVR